MREFVSVINQIKKIMTVKFCIYGHGCLVYNSFVPYDAFETQQIFIYINLQNMVTK
jgi:hypothetical protein